MLKKIGRYEIVGELGQGAMGIVYKGKDPRIGRIVALKTIHPGAGLSKDEQKEFYERFYREAQTAGNLSHPNIVTIFDADEDPEEKISFIAMEFIEGQSLQQLLDGDRIFRPEETLNIVLQIAEGLGYAHSNGIIHRDIKPANVILTPDNRVKITDFGIARIESSSLTRTGQFLGTPYYMAPEQIAGGQIDGRSDLFSLAVVFYQLLTREKPFSGNNITTILYKIVNQEPLPATRLNIGLSGGFDMVLTKGLAKNPEARYQDAAQFAEDIKRLLAGEPPQHCGADATAVVSQAPPPDQTIDASQLAPPAEGPAGAATSSVGHPAPPPMPQQAAATGTTAPAGAEAGKRGKSHATLIGFAAALTVVVIFLVVYLAFFNDRGGSAKKKEPGQKPEMVLADSEPGEGLAAVPGEPVAGDAGQAATLIEPPVEDQPAAAKAEQSRPETPEKKTEPEPTGTTKTVEQPVQKPVQQPSRQETPVRQTPAVTAPATRDPEPEPGPAPKETLPARPEEISWSPSGGGTAPTARPGETPAGETAEPAGSSEEEKTATPPPQDFGYLDFEFKHGFQAGRLTIRADGTEVYSQSFGGGDSGGKFKGAFRKLKQMANKSQFSDSGIQVPVGRYRLEVKVTVPGRDINAATLSARFRADQERCLSIKSNLIDRDSIELQWGCEDDDDDDEDDEEDDDDDEDDKDHDD